MLKITESCIRNTRQGLQRRVSGIHVKDYRELYQGYMLKITESCIRDTRQDYREAYQGYMLKITESCIRDTRQGLQRVVSGIHIKDYREAYPEILTWEYWELVVSVGYIFRLQKAIPVLGQTKENLLE